MGMGVKKPKKQKQTVKKKEEEIIKSLEGKEIRGVVRIAGKDIKGKLTIFQALRTIKGIGHSLAKLFSDIILKDMNLKKTTMLGELNEEQIQRLEHILAHPTEFDIPAFMLNRQKEYTLNQPRHLLGNDLVFAIQQDIQHHKDSQTWRGFRHTYAKKVRGQRTRTTGRKGMTVGVLRKAVKSAQATAAAQKQEESKNTQATTKEKK
ncbi:MAG: 30S ribosomal protein S13 [Candidatus Anstonellaceae archaeon]